MHVIDAMGFLPRRYPQNLEDDAIHVWLFSEWRGPFHAVAESPIVLALLASYARCAVSDLRIQRGPHGKPYLHDGALQFNLSHSGSMLLMALSRQQPLGVDVEARARMRPFMQLARRWFDAAEVAALNAMPQGLQQASFMRLWSCKEAVVKANGRGLGLGLDRVVFDLAADGSLTAVRAPDVDADSCTWRVVQLEPQVGVAGALAWCGPALAVHAFVADADHGQNRFTGL